MRNVKVIITTDKKGQRLFNAAPDLLEALEVANKHLGNAFIPQSACDLIHAALVKARGE